MSLQPEIYAAPWHRESFDRFLYDRLPALLADNIPLLSYHATSTGDYFCRVSLAVGRDAHRVEVEFADLPQPDSRGFFLVDGRLVAVLPIASEEALDRAEIRCVGDQLYDIASERLGRAPEEMPWDESMARAWLPLDAWFSSVLSPALGQVAQSAHPPCWLEQQGWLRRIAVANRKAAWAPGQEGRTCPLETPEGPNIGRILNVSLGATIRDGRLVVADDRPEASLGLSASMIPFLEHDDVCRSLMGANMMRQWLVPPTPEPALVVTGLEPDVPDFWAGRNLLTAFIPWGPDVLEDAIVISESCARRLAYPFPIEPGDKMSNRHGTKGVISRIVPDDQMPHLSDGTPVELVFSFIGLAARLNVGQELEAVWGRVAQAAGEPVVAPAFHSPDEEDLKRSLADHGLPADGMEQLVDGTEGTPLRTRSLVGWVYWGRLHHVAREKMHSAAGSGRLQKQSALEFYALRDAGAFETLTEIFHTRALGSTGSRDLAIKAAAGAVSQADGPTPWFQDLARRLAAVGIRADRVPEGVAVRFRFAPPDEPRLHLAVPVPHPWLPERTMGTLGAMPDVEGWAELAQANQRLEELLASDAPRSLHRRAEDHLRRQAERFMDALLTPDHLEPSARVLFTGRAVIAPGAQLSIDQVGVPEEIAWTLYEPLVARRLEAEPGSIERTPEVVRVLDEVMAVSRVIISRAPVEHAAGILAFQPVRHSEPVLRIHPMVCWLMNADFDGDQCLISLPITDAGQQDAADHLSVAAHLERDPSLVGGLLSLHDGWWGIAWLSLSTAGRSEIEAITGIPVPDNDVPLSRSAFAVALIEKTKRDGAGAVLSVLEPLARRGFEVAHGSGASLSPFVGARLAQPASPTEGTVEAWKRWKEQLLERIVTDSDYEDPNMGPQLLAIRSGARGRMEGLSCLVGPRGVVDNPFGPPAIIRHSLRQGLARDELFVLAAANRKSLYDLQAQLGRIGEHYKSSKPTRSFTVLSRAMRSRYPGIVFANAAAIGETDPLADLDSRLMVDGR